MTPITFTPFTTVRFVFKKALWTTISNTLRTEGIKDSYRKNHKNHNELPPVIHDNVYHGNNQTTHTHPTTHAHLTILTHSSLPPKKKLTFTMDYHNCRKRD